MSTYEIITIILTCLSLLCAIIGVICSIISCKKEKSIKKIQTEINYQISLTKSNLIHNAPLYNNCNITNNYPGLYNPGIITNEFTELHEEDKQ